MSVVCVVIFGLHVLPSPEAVKDNASKRYSITGHLERELNLNQLYCIKLNSNTVNREESTCLLYCSILRRFFVCLFVFCLFVCLFVVVVVVLVVVVFLQKPVFMNKSNQLKDIDP